MILIITPFYLPKMGGASIYFSSLVNSLKKYAEVTVLTTHYKNTQIIETSARVRIIRLIPNVLSSFRILRWPILIVSSFMVILWLYLRYKPRVMHMHATGSIAFGASLASYVFRMPVIKDARDLLFKKFNISLGNVKKYIACGKVVKERLIRFGIERRKILVIPVINHPLVRKIASKSRDSEQKNGNFHVIFVGSLEKEKGVDVLLQALEALNDVSRDIFLTFICGKVNRWGRNLLKKISGKPGKARISVLENLDYKKTLTLIAKADALVLPSHSEGYPRVIMEALELGTPVIATRVGGIPELIKNNVNGILVPPRKPEELSRAILTFVTNHELREKLRVNGRKCMEEVKWSWNEITATLLSLYGL